LAAVAASASLAFGALTLSSIASARSAGGNSADESQTKEIEPGPGYEPVDSFWIYSHPWSWHAVDERQVILWTTPSTPYLVELAYPSHDLKFAEAIGVTSFGNRVYAKFDALKVRGFRYPIDHIYKMSREEARNLERAS
jgi:hypothetical protein